MATPSIQAETTLRIRRTFAAPRDEVFRAWTEAQALKTWFAPSDQFVTRVPELDVRVGGRYRMEMEMAGSVHTGVQKRTPGSRSRSVTEPHGAGDLCHFRGLGANFRGTLLALSSAQWTLFEMSSSSNGAAAG